MPATHTFSKLLADYYGIHIADAASELATPKHIRQMATGAGFSIVQVPEEEEKPSMQHNFACILSPFRS